MYQLVPEILPLVITLIIVGLAALSLPWRRTRSIKLQTEIGAARQRVWNIVSNIDPDDPFSAALNPKTVTVEKDLDLPEINIVTLDMSGGHGTAFKTYREEILEERAPEYAASRLLEFDGRPFPFGPENISTIDLQETEGRTLLTRFWWGETRSLWQYIAVWRALRKYDKKLKNLSEAESPPVPARKSRLSWKSAAISALALASFVALLGWIAAIILLAILIIHEFGHWLAFRISGHPAPRIMLIPFLGGVAIGNHDHKSRFDEAFCALMGPAFSILPVTALLVFITTMAPPNLTAVPGWILIAQYFDGPEKYIVIGGPLLLAFGALNALQMLPILPLDGGQVLRAAMHSLNPVWGRRVLIAAAGLATSGFIWLGDYVLASIAMLGGVGALHVNTESSSVRPMGALTLSVIALAYAATLAVHMGAVICGLWALNILPKLL